MHRRVQTYLLDKSGSFLAGWWLVSFVLTHLPLSEDTAGIPYVDKLAHGCIYAGLAFLMALWWHRNQPLGGGHVIAIISVVCLYAVLDETLQILVGRTADIHDGLADLVGALIGLSVYGIRIKKIA